MFAGSGAEDQRLAAQTAIKQNLTVITGGPGTGKTRTVVVLLALLVEQFAASGRLPRIALAAPTGKAGARLKEAIRTTAEELKLPEAIRTALPDEATTLHRLLGTLPDSPYFRHDASRPLPVDVVIVDEASMVDLALMAKLFDAVPPAARLILLGDKDQLASVEAGYVLGDICQAAEAPGAPLHRHIVELRKNYRFRERSGIQQLSGCVNAGDAAGAFAELTRDHEDVASAELPAAGALAQALRTPVLAGFRSYLEAATPEEALQHFSRFRILAALRRGPFGVENLNRAAEQILAEAALIQADAPQYHGRPIIIRQNEPNLRLFNGDVGLLLRDEAAGGDLRAFFLDAEGALRRFLPGRLPAHETAFAMTVHKSQGSEFQRVLLVLPDREHPVCTRELVYTGLTRARQHVELWYREPALRNAIARRTVRTSGLQDALARSSA
jgi:exodeoxyribonuclease V alpha subunit